MNRLCKLTEWSRWGPCTRTCGLGERMRLRIPIEKHSTADEHQQKMMKFYRKFNLQHKKFHNDIHEEVDDVEGNDETEESREENMSDLDIILGASKSTHPCVNEVLVEKQTCGMKNKPCEYEIYGIPCKAEREHFKRFNFNHKFFSFISHGSILLA